MGTNSCKFGKPPRHPGIHLKFLLCGYVRGVNLFCTWSHEIVNGLERSRLLVLSTMSAASQCRHLAIRSQESVSSRAGRVLALTQYRGVSEPQSSNPTRHGQLVPSDVALCRHAGHSNVLANSYVGAEVAWVAPPRRAETPAPDGIEDLPLLSSLPAHLQPLADTLTDLAVSSASSTLFLASEVPELSESETVAL